MSMQDPIADMLTRIRNAAASAHPSVDVRRNKVCLGIAKVLKDEGYLTDVREIDDSKQGLLRLYIRYGEQGEKVLQRIDRASRPGRRVYLGVDDLPRVLNGLGICVVSTSKGIMSDRQCRAQRVGGEVLCEVC